MKWRTADRHIGVSTEQIRSSGLKPLWVCDAIARCARKTVAEAIAEALVTILEVLGSAVSGSAMKAGSVPCRVEDSRGSQQRGSSTGDTWSS